MRGLRKNPYRNREILEQIVAVVAVLAARRLDAHGQIPAELVLLAYLGLEPDGARSGVLSWRRAVRHSQPPPTLGCQPFMGA